MYSHPKNRLLTGNSLSEIAEQNPHLIERGRKIVDTYPTSGVHHGHVTYDDDNINYDTILEKNQIVAKLFEVEKNTVSKHLLFTASKVIQSLFTPHEYGYKNMDYDIYIYGFDNHVDHINYVSGVCKYIVNVFNVKSIIITENAFTFNITSRYDKCDDIWSKMNKKYSEKNTKANSTEETEETEETVEQLQIIRKYATNVLEIFDDFDFSIVQIGLTDCKIVCTNNCLTELTQKMIVIHTQPFLSKTRCEKYIKRGFQLVFPYCLPESYVGKYTINTYDKLDNQPYNFTIENKIVLTDHIEYASSGGGNNILNTKQIFTLTIDSKCNSKCNSNGIKLKHDYFAFIDALSCGTMCDKRKIDMSVFNHIFREIFNNKLIDIVLFKLIRTHLIRSHFFSSSTYMYIFSNRKIGELINQDILNVHRRISFDIKKHMPKLYNLYKEHYRLNWTINDLIQFVKHNIKSDMEELNSRIDNVKKLKTLVRTISWNSSLSLPLFRTSNFSHYKNVATLKNMYGKYLSYGYINCITHKIAHPIVHKPIDSDSDDDTFSVGDSDNDDENVEENGEEENVYQTNTGTEDEILECCICNDDSYKLLRMDKHPCYICTCCIEKLIKKKSSKKKSSYSTRLPKQQFKCPLCAQIVKYIVNENYQIVMYDD